MDRKKFLQTFLPATLLGNAAWQSFAAAHKNIKHPIPTPLPLQPGDTVGITCPANATEYKHLIGLNALKNWGLNVKIGNTVGKKWLRFAGTDEERLADFQQMLDDEEVKAIFFAKGGYGTMRIIDNINWDKFLDKPKWLIGFSDVTTVHLHVQANFGIPTIHADMITGFTDNLKDPSANTIHDILFGNRITYTVKGHAMNRAGTVTAQLVGGNLSLLQACSGSKSDIKTDGKILFIEDVGEYKYNIDRMMMNLKRSGKLDNLAGLMVGMFTATKSNEEETYTASIEDIIMDKVANYNYPVCFNFPSGHVTYNFALKMGVEYYFNVTRQKVNLVEQVNEQMPLPTMPPKFVEMPDSLKHLVEF